MPPQDPEQVRWFTAEIAPHEAGLKAWLLARYHTLTDADDIIQDSIVRVLKAKESAELLIPKAFLYATAKNLALDQLRRKQIICIDSLANSGASDVLDEQSDPHETFARNQELSILTEAIQSLPQRCRQIFTLRKVYGLSQKEISERLGVSANTVSAQLTIGFKRCSEYVLTKTRRKEEGR